MELRRKPVEVEVESICLAAEEAARHHVLSRIPLKKIGDLEVIVEAVGDKPLKLNVEIAVELASAGIDVEQLVDEAVDAAYSAAEAKARELGLCEITGG